MDGERKPTYGEKLNSLIFSKYCLHYATANRATKELDEHIGQGCGRAREGMVSADVLFYNLNHSWFEGVAGFCSFHHCPSPL